jgi:hypothetical protein
MVVPPSPVPDLATNNLMAIEHSQSVIDLHPWPDGLGFQDSSSWWAYVRSRREAEKLDLLLTMALLSQDICRLLLTHDQTLFEAIQFSPQMIALLSEIDANTLPEFTTALAAKISILARDTAKL